LCAEVIDTTTKNFFDKILVVDDDGQLRRAFRVILTGQGCTVIEARDGNEAIEEIKADCPDLVLLDINMRGMDGFETCKRIRGFSNVPIIVVTVRGDENDKVVALDAGADDYLVKPFGTQELLARIRATARRVPAEETPPFNSSGLEIDFERHRVIANGRQVHLTPTQFELLRFLILNEGKPVSHAKLIHLLWGPEKSQADRTDLRVFIRQLREKIEPDPAQPRYIHTEAGIGYRFDPDYVTATKTRRSN
jgi:two-component system, OmpR family, KDP operon response regulator KdpE